MASAQTYPDRPIRLVIPWPAGDPPDVVGRAVADKLPDVLGQPVVIENQPGANGEIGTAAVARAAPDGYTLLLSTGSSIAMGPAMRRVPYGPVRDFVPITQLFVNAVGAIPQMQAGKLRGPAVTNGRRMPQLPDLPAIAETPPGYELTSWYGVMAPRDTPAHPPRGMDRGHQCSHWLSQDAGGDRAEARPPHPGAASSGRLGT